METPETQGLGGKEVRGGRSPKTITFTANMSVAERGNSGDPLRQVLRHA